MTAVIIDDHPAAHQAIQHHIKERHSEVLIQGHAYNVKEGLTLIEEKEPELLFLDIHMPDGTAFDLLEKIQYHEFAIVFITGHNEYARLAIDFAALAYLDKPVEKDKFSEAIQRAKERLAWRNVKEQLADLRQLIKTYQNEDLPSRLTVSTSSGIFYIPIEEITYLHVEQGVTYIYQANNTRVAVSAYLIHYERQFKPYRQFMRVHKSYLINLYYVEKYVHDGEVTLNGGVQVPVSGRKVEELKRRLGEL